jgi:hypothetical protein
MSDFWRNWMRLWCIGVGLFGIVLAAGASGLTSGPAHFVLDVLNGPASISPSPELKFSLAVLGAVTIGWSIILFGAIEAAASLAEKGRELWGWLTAGVVTWYVIDGTLSMMTGFGLNVVPNSILLATFLLPLLLTGVLKRN